MTMRIARAQISNLQLAITLPRDLVEELDLIWRRRISKYKYFQPIFTESALVSV